MKIILEKNNKIFFSSDTHYHHKGICKGTSHWTESKPPRDFETLEEMNNCIVDNINAVVGEDDWYINLGDWSFGSKDKVKEFRDRIKCKNVGLILGNHDMWIEKDEEIQKIFSFVKKYAMVKVIRPNPLDKGSHLKHRFVLFHHPIASWDSMAHGVIHIHGHIHSYPKYKIGKGKMIDVGVDGNNFKPYELDEILDLMEKQPVKGLLTHEFDHHEN